MLWLVIGELDKIVRLNMSEGGLMLYKESTVNCEDMRGLGNRTIDRGKPWDTGWGRPNTATRGGMDIL